jgi:signal recognition particle GTPase
VEQSTETNVRQQPYLMRVVLQSGNITTHLAQIVDRKTDSQLAAATMSTGAWEDSKPKPVVIFVVGAPGSGKGTLCKRLANEFGLCHLSIGDYLRELCHGSVQQTPDLLGGLDLDTLRANLKARKLVDSAAIVSIIRSKLAEEQSKGKTAILVDGFPRAVDNAKMFEAEVTATPCDR